MKRHGDVIDDLLAENSSTKTRGFKKNLVNLVRKLEPDVGEELDVIRDYIAFVPDAYRIEEDKVTVFEVEDTHRIDKIKKWKMAWGWYAIDYFYIDCSFIICDLHEGRNELDMQKWLWEVCRSDEYPKGWPQASRRSTK